MKYKYTVWVPSLQKDIFATELTTRQQKELLKSTLVSNNIEFIENSNSILKENLDTEIDNLTLLDKLVILLKMRIKSIGGLMEYEFTCESCNKKNKNTLDLIPILNKLNQFNLNLEQLKDTLIELDYDIPNIKNEQYLNQLAGPEGEQFGEAYSQYVYNTVLFFVKNIKVGDKLISFDDMSITNRQTIISQLSPNLINKAFNTFINLYKHLSTDFIIIKCLCGKELPTSTISLKSFDYYTFLRFIFNDNLHNIYQHVYYMVDKLKFNASDVAEMSPGERDIYWGYYYKDKKEAEETRSNQNLPVDSQMDEPK